MYIYIALPHEYSSYIINGTIYTNIKYKFEGSESETRQNEVGITK